MTKYRTYTCKTCGQQFLSNKGCYSRTPKYCSKECYAKSLIKEKSEEKPKKKRNRLVIVESSCKWCGNVYKTVRPESKFCTIDCYHEWQRTEEAKEPNRPKAICEYCGKEFYAHGRFKGKERRYCSVKCANEYHASLIKDKTLVTKKCEQCGKEFMVKYGLREQKYCSKECRWEAMIVFTEGRRVKDRMTVKARRDKLTIPKPKRYLDALLIAQNYACVYCGKQMGNKPTIDHILPVSHGGNNEKGNLIYCCQSCNSKKGHKLLEEFLERYGFTGAQERIIKYQHQAIQIENL